MEHSPGKPQQAPYRLLVLVSLLTGTASCIDESGWLRLRRRGLGSSTHAFKRMLSAFSVGLACGGLWIRRKITAVREPVGVLGEIPGAMGPRNVGMQDLTLSSAQWVSHGNEESERM